MLCKVLVAIAFVAVANAISMKPAVFTSLIEKSCYKKDSQNRLFTLGQEGPEGPLGSSMENLISLIEKIEKLNERAGWTQKPDSLAALLLSRFHIDDYGYNTYLNVFKQDTDAIQRNRVRERLLNAESVHPADFPEDTLTDAEKCSMYFMLSHNINSTAQQGDRAYNARRQYPTTSRGQQGQKRFYNVQLTSNPRESGVVSLRNNEQHAIAPARVLFGIVASTLAAQTMKVADLIKLSETVDENDVKRDADIDVLLSVTLGDLYAYGSLSESELATRAGTNRFNAAGKWNSTACQTEYVLNSNSSRVTLAEIRGGIDGYAIGKRLRENSADLAKFKLSSLLRMYYSPTGIWDDYTSVCRRDNQGQGLNMMRDQVKNYMYAYAPIVLNQALPENRINDFVDSSNRDWDAAFKQASMRITEDGEWCDTASEVSQTSGSTTNNQPCETPSDVVVMIDLDATGTGDDFNKQLEIVTQISNSLDMRRYASSMTIVANYKNGGYGDHHEGLSRFAWNTTNRGCATCRLAFADRSNFGTSQTKTPDILFTAINTTLRDLKQEKALEKGKPGNPFIFFNYESVKKPADSKRFYEAKNNLKYFHRDVPILAVGRGIKDDLEDIAFNTEDVFETESPDPQQLAQRLQKRICETPAVFQHPECATRASERDTFSDYVTPGRKQYWAMYPEYFIKSYQVQFEFSVVNGPIKVCYRRGTPRPEEDDRNCRMIKPGEEPIVFRAKNPCHKYDMYNCHPFYFTVIGVREGTQTVANKCKEEGCLNSDQIKWTVSHTGISCNSSYKLATNFLPFVVITLLAFLRFDKKF